MLIAAAITNPIYLSEGYTRNRHQSTGALHDFIISREQVFDWEDPLSNGNHPYWIFPAMFFILIFR